MQNLYTCEVKMSSSAESFLIFNFKADEDLSYVKNFFKTKILNLYSEIIQKLLNENSLTFVSKSLENSTIQQVDEWLRTSCSELFLKHNAAVQAVVGYAFSVFVVRRRHPCFLILINEESFSVPFSEKCSENFVLDNLFLESFAKV